MTFRGVFAGILLLTGLEVVTSSPAAAGRFGNLITGIANVFDHIVDPTIPAIPNLAQI